MGLDELLAKAIGIIVPIVEGCGGLVIALGVGRALAVYIPNLIKKDYDEEMRALRIRLGQSMVMGLEFLVAADILKTSVSPTWNDILFLAALIGLRTLLNFLLDYELKLLDRRKDSS